MNPLHVIGAAGAGYLFLWLTAPLEFQYRGGAGPLLVLVAYTLLLAMGVLCGLRQWKVASVNFFLDIPRLRRFTAYLAMAGAIGLAVRIAERVFLRAGGEVTADFALNRDLIATGGSGPLAFVGSLLGPLLMLLPFLVLLARAGGDRRGLPHWAYAVLAIAYPLFDLVFQGTRSTAVIFLGLTWAAAHATRSVSFRPKNILAAALSLLLVIWGAGFLFWVRASQMGIDPVDSTFSSVYALFAYPNDLVLHRLRTSGVSGAGSLLYSYVHFCQYLLHGVYEFLYAATYVSEPTTYGLQTFYIPTKMVAAAVGATKPELLIQEGVLRSGIYTTLFGPVLYDFGILGGAGVSLAIGFGCGGVARTVRRGNLALLPLHLLIIGLLPFVFVVNWFTSGTGQFLLIGFVIVCYALRMTRFRFTYTADRPSVALANPR